MSAKLDSTLLVFEKITDQANEATADLAKTKQQLGKEGEQLAQANRLIENLREGIGKLSLQNANLQKTLAEDVERKTGERIQGELGEKKILERENENLKAQLIAMRKAFDQLVEAMNNVLFKEGSAKQIPTRVSQKTAGLVDPQKKLHASPAEPPVQSRAEQSDAAAKIAKAHTSSKRRQKYFVEFDEQGETMRKRESSTSESESQESQSDSPPKSPKEQKKL